MEAGIVLNHVKYSNKRSLNRKQKGIKDIPLMILSTKSIERKEQCAVWRMIFNSVYTESHTNKFWWTTTYPSTRPLLGVQEWHIKLKKMIHYAHLNIFIVVLIKHVGLQLETHVGLKLAAGWTTIQKANLYLNMERHMTLLKDLMC